MYKETLTETVTLSFLKLSSLGFSGGAMTGMTPVFEQHVSFEMGFDLCKLEPIKCGATSLICGKGG